MNHSCTQCGYMQSATFTTCVMCKGKTFIPDRFASTLRACPECGGKFEGPVHSPELNRPIFNCENCGAGYSPPTKMLRLPMTGRPVPADMQQCQTERPSTWPHMPSFMTLGPVSYKRCENKPAWIADDGMGQMSLCEECKEVCEKLVRAKYTRIENENATGRACPACRRNV